MLWHLEFLVSLLRYTPLVAVYINVHLNHNLHLLYTACPTGQTREFFSQINVVHDNIRFTMELETNDCMPFSDVCWTLRIWYWYWNMSKALAYRSV